MSLVVDFIENVLDVIFRKGFYWFFDFLATFSQVSADGWDNRKKKQIFSIIRVEVREIESFILHK